MTSTKRERMKIMRMALEILRVCVSVSLELILCYGCVARCSCFFFFSSFVFVGHALQSIDSKRCSVKRIIEFST